MRRLSILLILFTFYLTGFSQIIDFKKDKYWVDAGFGNFLTINEISGLPTFPQYFSVNLNHNKTLYKISYIRNDEFAVFGDIPYEEYNSVGLLLGKGYSWKYLQVQFSGGIGITGGIKRGDFLIKDELWLYGVLLFSRDICERDKFLTPSIPLQMDLLLKPIKYAGIGVTLFGDLNITRPYCGFSIKLSLGKLR